MLVAFALAAAFAFGVAFGLWLNEFQSKTYRAWYLQCRAALDEIAYNDCDYATRRMIDGVLGRIDGNA
jgi:hypothetical protein